MLYSIIIHFGMKKFLQILVIALCGSGLAYGQTKKITVITDDANERNFMVTPMEKYDATQELTFTEGKFEGDIEKSEYGFYNLVTVKGQSQVIMPVYLPGDAAVTLKLNLTGRSRLMIEGDNDNMALAAYSKVYIDINKSLWNNKERDVTKAYNDIKHFLLSADSIVQHYNCSENVRSYMQLWSYLSAYDCFTYLPRILDIKADALPYKRRDVLPVPYKILNTPLATLFSNMPNVVYSSIPNKNNLDSALIYLDEHYDIKPIKDAVKNNIAGRYVTRYNYAEDFDKGLERLRKATEKYGLDPKYAADFEHRKATVPGQPFPKNVILKDIDGNVVDFAKFRGKFIYIDVWASWCVPCLREVPMLQKMEKELKNKNVVFVSISVDAKEGPWKQKMNQLNMHGNQLHNPDNSLCEALNVKGIPFFVIYDAEGKLYMHGAPRPSQGPGVIKLLEGLGK